MTADGALDQRHRHNRRQDLPVSIEYFADSYVRALGIVNLHFHFSGSQRNAECSHRAVRQAEPEILEISKDLAAGADGGSTSSGVERFRSTTEPPAKTLGHECTRIHTNKKRVRSHSFRCIRGPMFHFSFHDQHAAMGHPGYVMRGSSPQVLVRSEERRAG